MPYVCLVCGYPNLDEPPLGDKLGIGGSDEICPCCGTHFGYHDAAGGDPVRRKEVYKELRRKWIANGMKWRARSEQPPTGWDPVKQLRNVEKR
jgi:hypothetical protein